MQGTEESVPMSGEGDVAPFPRHGCFGEMPNPSSQNPGRIAVQNDSSKSHTRYFDLADSLADGSQVWLCQRNAMSEFA